MIFDSLPTMFEYYYFLEGLGKIKIRDIQKGSPNYWQLEDYQEGLESSRLFPPHFDTGLQKGILYFEAVDESIQEESYIKAIRISGNHSY